EGAAGEGIRLQGDGAVKRGAAESPSKVLDGAVAGAGIWQGDGDVVGQGDAARHAQMCHVGAVDVRLHRHRAAGGAQCVGDISVDALARDDGAAAVVARAVQGQAKGAVVDV